VITNKTEIVTQFNQVVNPHNEILRMKMDLIWFGIYEKSKDCERNSELSPG
jgi:hypothetical protein